MMSWDNIKETRSGRVWIGLISVCNRTLDLVSVHSNYSTYWKYATTMADLCLTGFTVFKMTMYVHSSSCVRLKCQFIASIMFTMFTFGELAPKVKLSFFIFSQMLVKLKVKALEGNINVCRRFNGDPFKSCWAFSFNCVPVSGNHACDSWFNDYWDASGTKWLKDWWACY